MPRIATGLARPNPFQLQLDDDEQEYSQRRSYADADKRSRAELFREAFFRPGWKEKELPALRKAQKGVPLAKIFGKKK